MLYMCLHTKFANDRVFVSFLAKWVSNYQFEKKRLPCAKNTRNLF